MRIIKRIIDDLALLAAFDETGRFQDPQLVRNGRLRHVQQRRKVAHAHFLNIQRTDHACARGVAKDLEKLRDLVNGVLIGHLLPNAAENVLVNDVAFRAGHIKSFHQNSPHLND